MSETTAIEWADATWSPWEGCTKVGPGCDHCYAEGMNRWLRKGENWGPGAPRREYSDEHWEKPLKWNGRQFAACPGCGWRGESRTAQVRDFPGESAHLCPACESATLIKASRRVFPSVCDPFDNEVPDAWRARFFALIAGTPHLTWLLLTKRIGNVAKMIEAPSMQKCGLPDNVWLGATVVNQEEADRDIPKLLAVPARVRFLSIEPMLGPIELDDWLKVRKHWKSADSLPHAPWAPPYPKHRYERQALVGAGWKQPLHWIIAGGESGPKARPMHPDWARSLRDQCATAGVPFLFKQWGEWAPPTKLEDLRFLGDMMRAGKAIHVYGSGREEDGHFRKGDDHLLRIGKKAAGRLLDGVQHDGFPEVQR